MLEGQVKAQIKQLWLLTSVLPCSRRFAVGPHGLLFTHTCKALLLSLGMCSRTWVQLTGSVPHLGCPNCPLLLPASLPREVLCSGSLFSQETRVFCDICYWTNCVDRRAVGQILFTKSPSTSQQLAQQLFQLSIWFNKRYHKKPLLCIIPTLLQLHQHTNSTTTWRRSYFLIF